jgi:hypothetical protein
MDKVLPSLPQEISSKLRVKEMRSLRNRIEEETVEKKRRDPLENTKL